MMLERCENGTKFDGKNVIQDFDAKEIYLHPKNRSVSILSVEKCNVFIIFECSHDAVSKVCRLEFRFQSLLFQKATSKKCIVFV